MTLEKRKEKAQIEFIYSNSQLTKNIYLIGGKDKSNKNRE